MNKITMAIIVLMFGLAIVSIVIKYLWSYLVVRLFPGAVEQNLVTKDISWKVSVILAIIFLLISQK